MRYGLSQLLLAAPATILACSLALSAPASGVQPSSHLQEIQKRGKLVMLCFPNLDSTYVRPNLEVMRQRSIALAELHDPDAYEGSDIELIRDFAAELGVELEVQPITTSYSDLVLALAKGKGDLIASSLSITEERLRFLDFSQPTGSIWAVVAVPLTSQVSTLDDLRGRRGAAMRGSSQLEIFKAVAPPGVQLMLSDFSLETYVAVIEGEADFLLMDSAAAIGETPKPGLDKVKIAIRLKETPVGVAVPKDSDLLPVLNAFLSGR